MKNSPLIIVFLLSLTAFYYPQGDVASERLSFVGADGQFSADFAYLENLSKAGINFFGLTRWWLMKAVAQRGIY